MTVQQDSMVERYVAAVLDRVPAQRSATVEARLRSDLAAAIGAAQAQGIPADEAQRAAVASLGDPMRYAAQHGGRALHLIGPDYFPFYWRLLRLVLSIAVPIASVVVLLAEAAAGADPVQVVAAAVSMAFAVAVQVSFWITLVFALFDRYGTGQPMPAWGPSQLPHVRARSIGLADTVLSICLLTVLIAVLLWQRGSGLVTGADGAQVPLLNPALWDFWLPALIAVLAASILLEVAKYRTGRMTLPLALVNTALNLAFIAIVAVVFSQGDVVNPAIALPAGADTGLAVLPWLLVLIAVWDTVDGWRGLRRRHFVEQG